MPLPITQLGPQTDPHKAPLQALPYHNIDNTHARPERCTVDIMLVNLTLQVVLDMHILTTTQLQQTCLHSLNGMVPAAGGRHVEFSCQRRLTTHPTGVGVAHHMNTLASA